MAVYVDRGAVYPRSRKWPWGFAAHLTADTLDELHAFAAQLGLMKEWFQGPPHHPHYDLTLTKRRLALRKGAVEGHTWGPNSQPRAAVPHTPGGEI